MSNPRVALDTNILAYAEGAGDILRCEAARELLVKLPRQAVVLPAQVLGELHRVLTAKLRRSAAEARDIVLGWADAYEVADSNWSAMKSAFDLVADHNLQLWDALILSVAAQQQCRLLLSEDLQDGFTWHGLTVANPFNSRKHAVLADWMG
jgi:predicted nucleic acid-binding protein